MVLIPVHGWSRAWRTGTTVAYCRRIVTKEDLFSLWPGLELLIPLKVYPVSTGFDGLTHLRCDGVFSKVFVFWEGSSIDDAWLEIKTMSTSLRLVQNCR